MSRPPDFISSADIVRAGPLRRAWSLVHPLVERVSGIRELNGIYHQLHRPDTTPQSFCEEGLRLVEAIVQWPSEEALAPLRAHTGPLVIMANHPFGGTDALALMLLMERIRPGGWRLISNRLLARTPELAPCQIAVDPFNPASPANRTGMREALRFLKGGGVLGVFPAGRVSAWNEEHKAVLDTPWSDHFARLADAAGAAVALIHLPGQNSPLFLKVPLRWPRLRAMFLARELIRPHKPAVRFHIGPVLEPATITSLVRCGNAGAKLRARCFLLPEICQDAAAAAESAAPPEVAAPGDAAEMQREAALLQSGPQRLLEQGRFCVMMFQRHEAPALFHELTRLREITFRAAGQGSGAAVDVTLEDDYYHQLVLWDTEQQRLAGAYRLGFTEEVLQSRGQDALYLSHIFHIAADFFRQIGPAIELTRSFLHPDYQKEPLALALLWRGLGTVVAARPQIRSLFGSVTVPATVSDASRAVIVEHLRRHHSAEPALRSLIRPRAPFQAPGFAHRLMADAHAEDSIESLRDAIRGPDGSLRTIPPLIRHYLSMNARFIDYHVEREFGDALYCLLRVELSQAPLPHLKRFIGEKAAEWLKG